jgi:hypothetical protein
MKKTLLLPIFAMLFSCSTPESEKQTSPELYPTEKCTLSWYGDGTLILIDKNHSVNDTIINCSSNGTSDIDLVVRGYYELKVINCTTADILIINPTKEIVSFNGRTNGLTQQFFNK